MWMAQLNFWLCFFFFFNDTATTEIYTLSLHDALPISTAPMVRCSRRSRWRRRSFRWCCRRATGHISRTAFAKRCSERTPTSRIEISEATAPSDAPSPASASHRHRPDLGDVGFALQCLFDAVLLEREHAFGKRGLPDVFDPGVGLNERLDGARSHQQFVNADAAAISALSTCVATGCLVQRQLPLLVAVTRLPALADFGRNERRA